MKTRKPKWAKALSVKELKHIAESSFTGRASMASLKRNLEGQAKSGIHCRECRSIALKLGISVPPMEVAVGTSKNNPPRGNLA